MADELGLQGLNGIEIVDDLLAQLRKRLLADCSLRPTDSYSRGYSAKISYSINCYGLDQETVVGNVAFGRELGEAADAGGDGELEIPQEDDLTEVRERMERAVKEEEEAAEFEAGEEEVAGMERTSEGTPVTRTKRKYTRKVSLGATDGGAEDFKE